MAIARGVHEFIVEASIAIKGCHPNRVMDTYNNSPALRRARWQVPMLLPAKALRTTSTRIFVGFAPGGLQKDSAFGVIFFT